MVFRNWRFQSWVDYGNFSHPEYEARAEQEPGFDYFEAQRPRLPKKEIGEYVRNQGFNVPLIDTQEEWEDAFDSGDAMLRSELEQDYDGLSGLLSSQRIRHEDYVEGAEGQGYYNRLGRILLEGIRSGELPEAEFMSGLRGYRSWDYSEKKLLEEASSFRVEDMYLGIPEVSRWRYVDGTNVTMFADPHVKGRFHFGVIPYDEGGGYTSIGGYEFDEGEYDDPKKFRKHDESFLPRPYIEAYEAIRKLPRFDNNDCPVMELQGDPEGNVHFLQYLKTGQKINYIDPFEISATANAVRTSNARGITSQDGEQFRLYFEPKRLAPAMENEAIYCGLIQPRGIQVQFAARAAGFILHEAYISFQDNHFNSSPLYRPPLAAGFDSFEGTQKHVFGWLEEARSKWERFYHDYDHVAYTDIHVTSNGREMAIESDWDIRVAKYDDLK